MQNTQRQQGEGVHLSPHMAKSAPPRVVGGDADTLLLACSRDGGICVNITKIIHTTKKESSALYLKDDALMFSEFPLPTRNGMVFLQRCDTQTLLNLPIPPGRAVSRGLLVDIPLWDCS